VPCISYQKFIKTTKLNNHDLPSHNLKRKMERSGIYYEIQRLRWSSRFIKENSKGPVDILFYCVLVY
jgi:hypothetical protein